MLGTDLKRAKDILYHTHGVDLAHEDRKFDLKAFEFFAKLNLKGYKFTEERVKNYRIKSWKSSDPEQIKIYQVHSSARVDTVLFLEGDMIKKTSVHQVFNYRSYFLIRAGKPDLHFTINVKGDAMAFDVGKHTIEIIYEAIIIGEKIFDANALRKLLH